MKFTELDITSAIKKLHSISLNPLIEEINSSEYILLKILLRLSSDDKKPSVRVSDITKELDISAPSVTKILNNLEKKQLIIRETDKTNRRNTLVRITEKGISIKEQNDNKISKFVFNVYNRVGRENIAQFLHLADIIHQAIIEEGNNLSDNP